MFDELKSIGQRIEHALIQFDGCPSKKKGQWLAEQLNLSPQLISKWLNEKSEPSIVQIKEIANALDCCPSWIAFNQPIRHFEEERFSLQQANKHNSVVYAWYARACELNFDWKPVYGRPTADATLTTLYDTYDLYMVPTTVIRDREILEHWIEPDSYSHTLAGSSDYIFRSPMPPTGFHGFCVAVTTFEIPRGNAYRFTTFHSDALQKYQINLDSGDYFCVAAIGDEPRKLLPPKGKGLEALQEVSYKEFSDWEPFIDSRRNDSGLRFHKYPKIGG